MPKRVSDRTCIINFAMSCTEEEINNSLVEIVRAIQANRFPKGKVTGKSKGRAKAASAQTTINDFGANAPS